MYRIFHDIRTYWYIQAIAATILQFTFALLGRQVKIIVLLYFFILFFFIKITRKSPVTKINLYLDTDNYSLFLLKAYFFIFFLLLKAYFFLVFFIFSIVVIACWYLFLLLY